MGMSSGAARSRCVSRILGGLSRGDMRPFHRHKPLVLGALSPQVSWIQTSALNKYLNLGAGVSLILFQAREPHGAPLSAPVGS